MTLPLKVAEGLAEELAVGEAVSVGEGDSEGETLGEELGVSDGLGVGADEDDSELSSSLFSLPTLNLAAAATAAPPICSWATQETNSPWFSQSPLGSQLALGVGELLTTTAALTLALLSR